MLVLLVCWYYSLYNIGVILKSKYHLKKSVKNCTKNEVYLYGFLQKSLMENFIFLQCKPFFTEQLDAGK